MRERRQTKRWTRERLLNLIANANFDLFSIKGYKPTKKDIERWFDRYKKRETFKERMKKNKNN